MGRASSNKKVSRAARTGGGRTSGTNRPWLWWVAMSLVVVLGIGGIALSRDQYRDEVAAGTSLIPPIADQDHWHAAYGFYLCDEFAPPIQDQTDPKGIHTHADGLIHIHPFVRSAAGANATLEVFADATGATISDEALKVPGGKRFEEGETECDGQPGQVVLKVGDKVITEDIADYAPQDGEVLTLAFVPEGTEPADIPAPPSAGNLQLLDPETETLREAPVPTAPEGTTDTTVAGEGATTDPTGATDTTGPAAEGDATTTGG